MDGKIEKCGNKSCRRYSKDMPNNCRFTPYIKYCIEHKPMPEVTDVIDKKDIKFKEKELIETIKKVSLEKDDILIFQFNNLTKEASDDIYNILEDILPKKVSFLILPKEVDINVINIQAINKGEIK